MTHSSPSFFSIHLHPSSAAPLASSPAEPLAAGPRSRFAENHRIAGEDLNDIYEG